MQKFPKISACSSHESGGSQKFGKSVARAKKFKAAIKLSEKYDSNLQVTLSHNNNTNNFLGGWGGRVAKILGPTQNAWDPNLTRHAGTRTQNEKS